MGDIAPCIPSQLPGGSYNFLEAKEVKLLGHTTDKPHQSTSVYGTNGLSPWLSATDDKEPKRIVECVAMRGREDGQQLEVRDKITNTITTVQKDNLIMEFKESEALNKWIWEIDGKKYLIRIRKFTPKECWRLMGFTDEDYAKAAEVNSNSMLYKQAGNSIVPQVLSAIFKNLIGEKA